MTPIRICVKMESQDETVTRINVAERNKEIVQTKYKSKRHQIKSKSKQRQTDRKPKVEVQSEAKIRNCDEMS